MFEIGEVVEHILDDEYMQVIEVLANNEDPNLVKYACRTKRKDVVPFYGCELKSSDSFKLRNRKKL